MDFNCRMEHYVNTINKALENYVMDKEIPQKKIYTAMRYSLMAGGKRLRPVLSLSVCKMLGGSISEVLPFACAIEMIHTYSLIHDDLPAMDNDDYRRGIKTSHRVFGEAIAILAGDALLNYAFEIMLECTMQDSKNLEAKVKAISEIANASGISGMIGGQVIDIESEGKKIDGDLLKYMHSCKTGALIKAAVTAPAVLCGASPEEYSALEDFAVNIGLAFQIKDDILDVEGNMSNMGKESGGDALKGKPTSVTLYGINESKCKLDNITQRAISSLEGFGSKGDFLINLAKHLVFRNN